MPPDLSGALTLGALRRLPVHAISRAAGRVAAWRLPGPVRGPLLGAFARSVGANLDEVRDPLRSFGSVQDFFTRALVEGARPLDPDPRALLSPCDGSWGVSGRVEAGQILQVKGRPYSLADLLGDDASAASFEGGSFATLYLAPRDYHRFHAPCDAEVARAVYLPGSLWPVNRIGVEGVDGLFASNERIVAFLRRPGDAEVGLAIAAVGATMVGKVKVTFDTLTTQRGETDPVWRHYDTPPRLARGAEWGRFEFGSTLVLVTRPDTASLEPREPGTTLRLGERIGRLGAGGGSHRGDGPEV